MISKRRFYKKPNFYRQIERALSSHRYDVKGDYSNLPKKLARKLKWIERSQEKYREARSSACEAIEAHLISLYPNDEMQILCSQMNLNHKEAYDIYLKWYKSRTK